jgi:hypothetical protein
MSSLSSCYIGRVTADFPYKKKVYRPLKTHIQRTGEKFLFIRQSLPSEFIPQQKGMDENISAKSMRKKFENNHN